MAGSTPETQAKLFTPFTLGGSKDPVQLKHRIVMAPLTRVRTGDSGVCSDLVAAYYAQRATDGGLIIAEAANISPSARGYYGSPGLFTQEQVEGWKLVSEAIHDKGGKVFVQLWHTGRVSHPLNQPGGILPVSSAATDMTGVTSDAVTPEGRSKHVTPRALDISEIPGIAEDYKKAALNALAGGCDGVELHAANGYIIEQFLCDGVNTRTDAYGGPLENRARFLFEMLESILSVVDSSKVGIRLSPFGVTFGCTDSSPLETYSYVIKKLNDYNLAYIHIIEPRGQHFKSELVPEGGIAPVLRPLYKGVYMTASGFKREEAIKVVEEGTVNLVAFGRDFISNPDLVKRIELDLPLNKGYIKTYQYLNKDTPPELGYTDYPFYEAK